MCGCKGALPGVGDLSAFEEAIRRWAVSSRCYWGLCRDLEDRAHEISWVRHASDDEVFSVFSQEERRGDCEGIAAGIAVTPLRLFECGRGAIRPTSSLFTVPVVLRLLPAGTRASLQIRCLDISFDNRGGVYSFTMHL